MDELSGPSTFEIKKFIKDKIQVEFHTVNDKTFKGQIIWFDKDAFQILENGKALTLLRNAVVCYNAAQV